MTAAVMEWLEQHQDEMVRLLGELVNIDSNSYDKAGVDEVATHLKGFFESHGISTESFPVTSHGDALKASVSGGEGNRPIMLLGHRDTVFPTGEVERRPFTIRDGKGYGPGVADMKPGLVINAFVLAAFAACGGHPCPLVGLFTGDEEIGSPTSREIIKTEAAKSRLVFNSEPSRPGGNIVTERKGGIFCHCEVAGKAAHSGGFFEDGRSAIEELARKIQAFHALTDLERGITVNVGLIAGGQSVNTVAAEASCEIDIRYLVLEDRDWIISRIREIAENCSVDGTSSVFSIKGEFSPLNPSAESALLFGLYQQAASSEGVKVEGERSGGCADSGFVAEVGTPVICGVGPTGGNYHRPDEWVELSSLSQRAKIIARTILALEGEHRL